MTDGANHGRTVPVSKYPLPDGLEPSDTTSVRTWIRAFADRELAATGTVGPRLVIVCADGVVTAPLAGLDRPGDAPKVAAWWRSLGELEGARQHLRMGTVLLGAEGASRPVAAAMAWSRAPSPDGERWWLAHRSIGELGGADVPHGGWTEREGAGFEDLDPSFRAWIDPEGLRAPPPPPSARAPDAGLAIEIVACARLPGHPTPTEVEGYLLDVGRVALPEVGRRGIDRLWVFAFVGDLVEWWRIGGDPGCTFDDLLRNVARASGAHALGLAASGLHELADGSIRRALDLVAEFAGRRVRDRIVFGPGPDGLPRPVDVVNAAPLDVPERERWVGVPPAHDLSLRIAWRRVGPAVGES